MNSGIRIISAALVLLGLSFQAAAPILGQHSHKDAQGTYVHFHDGIFSELLESSNSHSHHGQEHFHPRNATAQFHSQAHQGVQQPLQKPGLLDELLQPLSGATSWSQDELGLQQEGPIALRDYLIFASQKLAPARIGADAIHDLSPNPILVLGDLQSVLRGPSAAASELQAPFAHTLPPDIVTGLIPFRTPPPC